MAFEFAARGGRGKGVVDLLHQALHLVLDVIHGGDQECRISRRMRIADLEEEEEGLVALDMK